MKELSVGNHHISIATRSANYRIPIKEIIYIESDLRKINIITINNTYSCYEKLDTLEQALTNSGFIRCHKSYLVPLDRIKCYDNHTLQLSNTDTRISVSRQHQQDIRLYLQKQNPHGILTCTQGTYEGYTAKIKPEQRILIGRDGNVCDIIIQLPMVSRLHCEIIYHEKRNQYEIIDHSSNGTFIHGDIRLIPQQQYAIDPDTELCFGDQTTIFKVL